MSDHPTVPVVLDGEPVDVDAEIAPLIGAMARAGIRTVLSCQNMKGMVWIHLDDVEDLATLLSAVAQAGDDDIYPRLSEWRYAVPASSNSEEPVPDGYWRYSVTPYLVDDMCWPHVWSFRALVEFPPSDIAEVTRRVEEFADWVGPA